MFPNILGSDSKFSSTSLKISSQKENKKKYFAVIKIMRKTKSYVKKHLEQKVESEPTKERKPEWVRKHSESSKFVDSHLDVSPTFNVDISSASIHEEGHEVQGSNIDQGSFPAE